MRYYKMQHKNRVEHTEILIMKQVSDLGLAVGLIPMWIPS